MERHRAILPIATLLLSSTSGAVVIGDKNWRQPAETVGFSYDDIASSSGGVCYSTNGACSGSIGGVDFTGWIWASHSEVGELFNLLVGHPGIDFSNSLGASLSEYNSLWAPTAVDVDGPGGSDSGYFFPTYSMDSFFKVEGITRTTSVYDANNAFTPGIWDDVNPGLTDGVATTLHGAKWIATEHRGLWMYKPASPIPIPATAWLLAPTLFLMGFMARRSTTAND